MSEKQYVKKRLAEALRKRTKVVSTDEHVKRMGKRFHSMKRKYQTKGEKLSIEEMKTVRRKDRVRKAKMAYRQPTGGMSRKVASTRYMREFAKGTGRTVKQLANKDYQTAMKNTGKTGNEAFRTGKTRSGPVLKRFGGKHKNKKNFKKRVSKMKPKILIGDPLNKYPEVTPKKLANPDIRNVVKKGYVSKLLSAKKVAKEIRNTKVKGGEYKEFGRKYSTLKKGRGGIILPVAEINRKGGANRSDTFTPLRENEASGTISKREKVRANEGRRKKIKKEGVGTNSLKEQAKIRKKQTKKWQEENPERLKEHVKKANKGRVRDREKVNITKTARRKRIKLVKILKGHPRTESGSRLKKIKTIKITGGPLKIKSSGLTRFGKGGF